MSYKCPPTFPRRLHIPEPLSIETMTDMAHHRNLQELDLSHNALEVLQGLSSLKYLRILKMDHNKIRRITGLDGAKKSWKSVRTHADLCSTPFCYYELQS